ncbi:MAG: RAD55 family ATPase [Thermoplasmatota archaeon]
MPADRRSTGLAGLDAQLEGGVPAGCHVVLAEPMNATELLAAHLAAKGSLMEGGAAYLATDVDPEVVAALVERLGGGDALAATALDARKPTVPKVAPGARVVVDSFSTLAGSAGWDAAWAFLLKLRAAVADAQGDLFVFATKGLHEPREEVLLQHTCDGVFELGFDRQGFGLYPYLQVRKLRGVPGAARLLLFKETEKGLFMESTRRVF